LSSELLYKNIKNRTYKIKIFAVLYGCEAWFLMLMDEHRLRVFENKMPMKTSRPKEEEMRLQKSP
jgi:hypothetical protein